MAPNTVRSFRLRNYKCFGPGGAGFDQVLPLNLVIGRNNSGKSSLLELVEYAVHPYDISALGHKGQVPQVTLTTTLTEESLRHVFSESMQGGPIPGNHWGFGRQWIDKPITWSLGLDGRGQLISVDPPPSDNRQIAYFEKLAKNERSPLSGSTFKRLRSDRDISPEPDDYQRDVNQNGQGATTLIRYFLTKAALPSDIVEIRLLAELNKIFEPDAAFQDITVQQLDDGRWEIYLGEATKGRIALSQSGSGLKTVLLLLTYLHLIPVIEKKGLDQYVFGFEELENNLHPALLRKLFIYLREIAVSSGCSVFVTTHSNVVIDLFANDEQVQLVHVQHDGSSAKAAPALAYVQRRGILDDLDIRASDLLQSNGVVWVEGPSDRLYFKRWIDLWTSSQLQEGAHYQCVLYGGRLLAHLSAEDPEIDAEDLIRILRVNRNALILIDSDRPKKGAHLNGTKNRLVSEVETLGGMAWVTGGREVENYIPASTLQTYLGLKSLPSLNRYVKFETALDTLAAGEGKKYLGNKVRFAAEICPALTRQSLGDWLDLGSRLDQVCDRIRAWNRVGQVGSIGRPRATSRPGA